MSLKSSIKSLFRRIFFGERNWAHTPFQVDVHPRYKQQVEEAYWYATIRLGPEYKSLHGIKRVRVIDGTIKRPMGWAVECAASPTGYAGGWTDQHRREIVAVADPTDGRILDSTLRHEWAEAILWANNVRSYEDRHLIIGARMG